MSMSMSILRNGHIAVHDLSFNLGRIVATWGRRMDTVASQYGRRRFPMSDLCRATIMGTNGERTAAATLSYRLDMRREIRNCRRRRLISLFLALTERTRLGVRGGTAKREQVECHGR